MLDTIDAAGPVDHAGATWRASPNFGTRYEGKSIDSIVLHYTGMSSGQGAEDWLCDHRSGVSSHYVVHEDGRIVQLVREIDRAWHAGVGCWKGERDMNSVSVGVEIVNRGHLLWSEVGPPPPLDPFPESQIDAVIQLCLAVMARHGVEPARVLGHSDLAPHRKRDPGEAFPWDRLGEAGIGLVGSRSSPGRAVDTADPDAVTALQRDLARLGFDIEPSGRFCESTRATLRAFQRHWRPALVDGRPDASTVASLRSLLRT